MSNQMRSSEWSRVVQAKPTYFGPSCVSRLPSSHPHVSDVMSMQLFERRRVLEALFEHLDLQPPIHLLPQAQDAPSKRALHQMARVSCHSQSLAQVDANFYFFQLSWRDIIKSGA